MNKNFTGIRLLIKARELTYGYDVLEYDGKRFSKNNMKANETKIRVNKHIIGEIIVSEICIGFIKSDDTRYIKDIYDERFKA